MIGLFLTWLYSDAPAAYLGYARQLSLGFYNYFSIPLMLSTVFEPWRHDAVDMSRAPVRLWPQIMLNNAVSRCIGFVIRISVVIGGSLVLFIVNVSVLFFFIAWYLLPFLLAGSVLYGFWLIIQSGA